MGKRYFIELSRKDIGLVSYFPGLEIKGRPKAEWIDKVLVPAVEPIARRRSAKIREVPLTFWIGVRGTARRPAEIFLFVTPAYPGAMIQRALKRALEPIKDAKVHAGREPIPEEAFPCIQILRGRIIRFYSTVDGYEGFHLTTVLWKDGFPRLALLSIPENDERITVDGQIDEVQGLVAEAMILSVSNGEECRRLQKALTPVAREVD
jgi:hypothetical protein